jgi:hypothetical protein
MNATKQWNHDAFFDYIDRWMTENDSAAVIEIKKAKGWDYSGSWNRQRQCWDAFVENMWKAYRGTAGNDGTHAEGGVRAPIGKASAPFLPQQMRRGDRVFDVSGRMLKSSRVERNGVYFVKKGNDRIERRLVVEREKR